VEECSGVSMTVALVAIGMRNEGEEIWNTNGREWTRMDANGREWTRMEERLIDD
jgi:hypothetical protein